MPKNGTSYIGINRHRTSIVTNIRGGYDIFNIDPLKIIFSEKRGKYSIIETFGSSSLVAAVGNGEGPAYSTRHLHLINLVNLNCICTLTYPSTIIWVRMTADQLIVSLTDRIYIYSLCNMKLLYIIDDLNINKNTLSVSYGPKNKLLAYPLCNTTNEKNSIKNQNYFYNITGKNKCFDEETSQKQLSEDTFFPSRKESYRNSSEFNSGNTTTQTDNNEKDITGDVLIFDLTSLQPYLIIEAHKRKLQVTTLSNDGTMLATASKLGTIIRVFKVSTGERICQFRRGRYPATINCISFSEDNKYLIVSSSSHKIHIFSIEQELHTLTVSNNSNDQNNLISAETTKPADLPGTLESEEEEEFVVVPNELQSIKYPRNIKNLLKASSRSLSREAYKQFNKYFADESKSNLIPRRHVAFCRIPDDISTSSTLVFMGDTQRIKKNDYPHIYQSDGIPNKNKDQDLDWIYVRKIYLINEDGYFLVYFFDPLGEEECILSNKLLLFDTD